MCGICCIIPAQSNTARDNTQLDQRLLEILKNRGPDIQHQLILDNGIVFYGSVLWQQGGCPTKQPLVSDKFILLFNGDIFNASKDDYASDTSWLLSRLDDCKDEDDLLQLFRSLKGPYSLILYDKSNKCVYFTRDPLGRNSLILERNHDFINIQSSTYVSDSGSKTIEVPAFGVFKLSTTTGYCTIHPWNEMVTDQPDVLTPVSNIVQEEVQVEQHLGTKWSASERRQPLYCFKDAIKNIPRTDETFDTFENLLAIEIISKTVEELSNLFRKSVKDRVINTPKYCSNCIFNFLHNNAPEIICKHAKIGILFSGGIDCTILAAIAHEYIAPDEPIDLINVAFEPVNKKSTSYDGFNVPDRISAIESFNELQTLFPKRQWNLVEVNVERNELQSLMSEHIRHLIYPLDTVLDESLGCAFWFASRGRGRTKKSDYTSPSRVILVGSGADELFGGYIRHRNAYNRCNGTLADKVKCLNDELKLDWQRIPSRNLGRDDRIIADNGRTSRAPFIEENIVKFVTELHPLEICCFELEQGVGDKLLLRLVGFQLGLRNVTQFKKRAIQFGSRVADKSQNAKDTSVYLSKTSIDK